ncbi:hypothetical protein DERP_009124 [Dermatophagoides pteronyssinus]|uniref:Uncharacterized protein n=1 Tax=Dermatophagoides pteronyssinus TaxID=6956 RepID=A0ABQ8JR72_DERPT|nr:hypothetical protein DERP_009124 [Dermatophagoides pteronyssinus]
MIQNIEIFVLILTFLVANNGSFELDSSTEKKGENNLTIITKYSVSSKIFLRCLSICSKSTILVRKNDGSIVITLIPVPINSRRNTSENTRTLCLVIQ